MTTQKVTTQLAQSRFATGRHNNTFGRSWLSEIYKLLQQSNLINAAVFALLLVAVPVITAISYNYEDASLYYPTSTPISAVVQFAALLLLHSIIIGATSVTREYATNTMRTTTLATPNRAKAYLAKQVALATYTFVVSLVIIAVLVAVTIAISPTPITYDLTDLRVFAFFLVFLVLTAMITHAVGYLTRSTSITIAVLIFLFYILPMVLMAFNEVDFVREQIMPLTFTSLLEAGLHTANDGPSVFGATYGIAGSMAIYVCYTILFNAAGFLRYQKSDV